jgi:hypothetical protein
LIIHAEGGAGPDHLVHRLAQLHLDIIALAGNPHVGVTEFTKKEQGRSSLLAKSQLESVLLTALPESFIHVIGHSVKTVRRAGPVYPLVRALVVVVTDPVIEPLAGVGE